MAIHNVLTYHGRNILVLVEGHHPHFWSCGATGNLAKVCHLKNPALPSPTPTEKPAAPSTSEPTTPATTNEPEWVEKSGSLNEWTEVVRRGKSLQPLLLCRIFLPKGLLYQRGLRNSTTEKGATATTMERAAETTASTAADGERATTTTGRSSCNIILNSSSSLNKHSN